MIEISHLMERAEKSHEEVALEYYNALSGTKDQLNVVEILQRYPELYSRETYDLVALLTDFLGGKI